MKRHHIEIIIIIIVALLTGAVLILSYGGIWIGNYKYKFNIFKRTAYFSEYRGRDTGDILPDKIYGFNVKLADKEIRVCDFDCYFNSEKDGVSIEGFHGSGILVLPCEVLGKPVYNIEDIENNEDITGVVISKNPANKYWGIDVQKCDNLQSVEYENGTKIANGDFYGCKKLKQLIFPEGVEKITAWYANTGLEEVFFPETVKNVNGYHFNRTEFEERHKKDKYYSVGDSVLLFYNGPIDEIVIPAGIKYLYNFDLFTAEEKKDVKRVYFPDSLVALNVEIPDDCEAYFGEKQIDGLDKCAIDGTVIALAKSPVETYCKEHNIKFRAMTEEEEAVWREKTEAASSEITNQE